MASKENEDIGLQDLLFNAAVGCILLFIIFSIQIGGDTILKLHSTANKGGYYSGTSSLPIPSKLLKGKMKTVRIVELSNLDSEIVEIFERNPSIGQWNISRAFETDFLPELQVHLSQAHRKIIYFLITDEAPESEIRFEVDALDIPSNTLVDVKARILEGAAMMEAQGSDWAVFEGIIEYPRSEPAQRVDIEKVAVIFRIDSQIDNILDIVTDL